MKFLSGGESDFIRQNAQHKLFVEGKNDQAIDPIIIQELLNNNELTAVTVSPMGHCDNVRSAAQALIDHHPAYYFLIDRDDQNLDVVEKSWNTFPNKDTYNMLIWSKRELENYFIDPHYLSLSQNLKKGIEKKDLESAILEECNRRIILDITNLTLMSLQRELEKKPLRCFFREPCNFTDVSHGLEALNELPQLKGKKTDTSHILNSDNISQIYSKFLQELSGGTLPLQYNSGNWLDLMSGKEIYRSIVNQYFVVKNLQGTIVQGSDKEKYVAKELLKLEIEKQPSDFKKLVDLLKNRQNHR